MTTLTTVRPDTEASSPRANMDKLFKAKSIALIGASADPTKLGSSPITAMQNMGYTGRISVVNPRYPELLGYPCYPSIDDLPDDVDVAMVILPAAAAIDAAEACVAKGIKALVMIPQGFGEAGGEGLVRDQRLLALARQGVAITGPNTNGIANVANGIGMSIGPIFQYKGAVQPGRIGVISQSGAMVSSILTKLNQCGLGIGKAATCGNELVLNVADYLDYLSDDAETDAIVLYLETIRDMAGFKGALAHARSAGKPVIAIKVGESDAGEKATLSHTGAIAGSYRNTIAFLQSEGVYVADDLETLASITECLMRYDWSDKDEPGKPFIASISGGFAAQTADVMARLGMPLEQPSTAGMQALSALPTQAHAVNPYDIAAQNALIPEIIAAFQEDGFNQLLFGLVMLKPAINEQVAQMLVEAKAAGMNRLFALSPQVLPGERKRFNDAGILVTDNVPSLLKALGAIEAHRSAAAGRVAAAGAFDETPTLDLPTSAGLIDEARSKALIEKIGIRTPQNRVLPVDGTVGDIAGLARPLVMKGLSDKIAHKTEHGLVALRLQTDTDIDMAWSRIVAALAKADPDADSVLVEEMIGGGMEAILGVQRDPIVGPVVVLGAGGILVELLDDAVVLIPPFSADEARAALRRTRFGTLLTGYRGTRYDIDALANAAAMLGRVALAQPGLESVDINPLLVQPDTGGVVALDAKITVAA